MDTRYEPTRKNLEGFMAKQGVYTVQLASPIDLPIVRSRVQVMAAKHNRSLVTRYDEKKCLLEVKVGEHIA